MADNVAITAGSGTTVATDEISIDGATAHVQRVKPVIGAAGTGTDAPGDATNGLDVDVTRLPASTNTIEVVGDAAHDAAVAGNPLLAGGEARTTNPTAVADGDAVRSMHDDVGRQVVVGSVRDLKVAQATTITSSTTETTVLTAGAAGVFHDVYAVLVANTSATATDVTFKDATGGTTRFNLYAPAGQTVGFTFSESGAHNQATAANNWTATCGTSVASVKVTVLAVKNV